MSEDLLTDWTKYQYGSWRREGQALRIVIPRSMFEKIRRTCGPEVDFDIFLPNEFTKDANNTRIYTHRTSFYDPREDAYKIGYWLKAWDPSYIVVSDKTVKTLEDWMRLNGAKSENPTLKESIALSLLQTEKLSLDQVAQKTIQATMKFHDDDIEAAAKSLDISVKELYRKIKSFKEVGENV